MGAYDGNPDTQKSDKQTLANYRAISLLSIPDKVLSRVLLIRMQKKKQKILPERVSSASNQPVERSMPSLSFDK